MELKKNKVTRRARRKVRIRRAITGTAERPRLTVYRSLNHIYAQLVDDLAGKTIASASTRDKGAGLDKTGNASAAATVGSKLAEKAKAKGVKNAVFDRNGFRYHGRIKALADAARKGGLDF
jgi:large subunit ribosomal protein L18